MQHGDMWAHRTVQGQAGGIDDGGRGRPLRRRARRDTARAAVRVGYLLVDPWGPSRFRRWLHVAGARLGTDVVRPPSPSRTSPPREVFPADLTRGSLGDMAGGGAR